MKHRAMNPTPMQQKLTQINRYQRTSTTHRPVMPITTQTSVSPVTGALGQRLLIPPSPCQRGLMGIAAETAYLKIYSRHQRYSSFLSPSDVESGGELKRKVQDGVDQRLGRYCGVTNRMIQTSSPLDPSARFLGDLTNQCALHHQ